MFLFSFFANLRFNLAAVLNSDKFLDRAKSAGGNANTLPVNTNGLEVHVLATLGSDVGVAAGVAKDGALSAQLTDAGHRDGSIDGKRMGVG